MFKLLDRFLPMKALNFCGPSNYRNAVSTFPWCIDFIFTDPTTFNSYDLKSSRKERDVIKTQRRYILYLFKFLFSIYVCQIRYALL